MEALVIANLLPPIWLTCTGSRLLWHIHASSLSLSHGNQQSVCMGFNNHLPTEHGLMCLCTEVMWGRHSREVVLGDHRCEYTLCWMCAGNAQWLDSGHHQCLILWKRLDEWAAALLEWARSSGMEDSVTTVEELLSGDEVSDFDSHLGPNDTQQF